jgi:hypothetical protein
VSERLQQWRGAPGRAWQRWVAFLSQREDAASLAVARIISGSSVCVHLVTMGLSGAGAAAWVSAKHGGAHDITGPAWLGLLGGATPFNVYALIFVGAVVAALMALGIYTRATVFLTWFCFKTLSYLNDQAGGSSDDLLLNGLFVLMWSGCGRALSIDSLQRRREDPAEATDAPAWPRYVLIFQIITVYWTTGVQKVSNSWWPPPFGSADAIWFILQDPNWTRWLISAQSLAPFFRLTQLATAVTWLFENSGLLFLLAFWFRSTRERPGRVRAFFNAPLKRFGSNVDFRLLYLAVGFSMHFGIWVLMEVGPFFNAVLVCYACCITPAEWRAVIDRLRFRRASSSQAPARV